MSEKFQTILRGKLYSALRRDNFLPITVATSEQELRQLFDADKASFWKAVRWLERQRELRRAPEGLYYVPPEDRY
jgi:hypothetical protein